ncbi:methyl-accepting chemotaxis protein [Thiomicrorhabdus sp. zzn3]|uniref:methyl-accepting chemotaxis protein n=1 Tax=Thiomicrorhabdus sp. zzn3 TaxID=3039775 RepID=UPI002436FCC5|nr:methyl-accepting chemotaxis protein [Thiomicrorhabdus sp. zzn3]MDG6778620.1 methyl-accepting chemotaxis protein [Thiomicrorhabdus sp. zzn3]
MTSKENLRFITNVDANAHITFINEDYQQWLGYSLDEIKGQPTQILRADNVPEIIQKTIRHECRQNRTLDFVIHEKKRNGETFWVNMTIQPVFENKQYQGYTSVKRLIEDPKQIRQAQALYRKINQGKMVYYNGQWVSKTKHRLYSLLGLHKATLSQKIFSALLLIALLILGGAYLYEQNEKRLIEEEAAGQHSKLLAAYLNKLMMKKSEIGLTNAVGLTFAAEIRRAAAAENQTVLANNLANIGQHYRSLSDLKNIKLHFTNEKMQSFYKSWKPLDGQVIDDLSNRPYLQAIAKEQKPMVVNAVSSAGFNIKSIVPLIENGRYEGAVEFIQGLGSIRRDFARQGQQYLLAVSADYALAGDKYRAQNANNIPVSADKKWVVGHNQHFSMEKSGAQIETLRTLDLNQLFKRGYLITPEQFHYSQPIYDFDKQLIGYHVISEPVAEYRAMIAKQFEVAENTFLGILISIVAMFALFMLLLMMQVINPIRRTQRTMENAVENTDLFARIHTYGNDEIHQMAKAYNRQSMMAQVVISEVNTAMTEVVSGRLSHKISFPFESDFGLLKDRINATADGLKSTFDIIGHAMDNLRNGEFDTPLTNTLKGEYARVIEDCNFAMQSLSQAFKEINQVMSYAARGKFDERIHTLSSGDIKQLQITINQSLETLESGFSEIVSAAQSIAAGDFTQPITRPYEYTLNEAKQAINDSISSLTHTLSQVLSVTNLVREGIHSVVEGTQSLNQRTQEQAASLEETSAAMEQTTAQIRSNLDNTHAAQQITQTQSSLLADANTVMQETKTSMNNIQEASDKIKEITTMIDTIAFQTNLLALNAAVEAARAGEHGRGFAVVAGEVRSLAAKSAEAAKEISTLIEQTSGAINIGVAQVDKVGLALGQVTGETQKVLDVINEVSRASQEQSHGVDEVNRAIIQIDGTTQQNAALVEETTATTEALLESAQQLQESVSQFRLAAPPRS